jgi:hypothetical protein
MLPGQLLLKVKACGIDVHAYQAGLALEGIALGQEFSGEVVLIRFRLAAPRVWRFTFYLPYGLLRRKFSHPLKRVHAVLAELEFATTIFPGSDRRRTHAKQF